MIAVLREGDRYRPVAMCDFCEQRIDNAKQGNFLWEVDQQAEPTGRMVFTHKACNRAFEAAHLPAGQWMGESIAFLPLMLAGNLQVNWKKATEEMKLFHSISLR